MFNSFNIYQQDRLVPYARTINEYKAPTDESIKLYNEFLERAREELIEKGKFCSNEVNVTYSIYKDHLQNTVCCYYNIVINGKLIKDKFGIPNQYFDNYCQFFDKLKLHILEAIGNYIVMDIAKTAGTQLYEATK